MATPSPVQLELLIVINDGELSGRDVAKQFKRRTGKQISYGTLYTTLRRMKDVGWVQSRDDRDRDGRIRYFKLQEAGHKALRQAAEHYAALALLALE